MKYKCGVCGYVYDESKEGVKFSDLPDDWVCPVCGERKEGFELVEEDDEPVPTVTPTVSEWDAEDLRELSAGQLSALCSNLARGCSKQQLSREAELFTKISKYFESQSVVEDHGGIEELMSRINSDLGNYGGAKSMSAVVSDRGALRVLTWSEKVTIIMESILERYLKNPHFLDHTNVYVCDICGFIYIGDEPPSVCPVCKVPGFMILMIERRD